MYRILDAIPWWVLLAAIAATLWAAKEGAHWLGRRAQHAGDAATERKSHAGIVVAALLALLGLLLAFSFSIVESRFLARKKLVLEEANAIGTTYLRADMLPAPHSERIQELLRDYVELRLSIGGPEDIHDALVASESIHHRLWMYADDVAEQHPSPIVAIFVEALNSVLDLHQERVTVSLHNRLPGPILLTLFFVSVLSMIVLGYSSGLGRARALAPTAALILAAGTVIVLIVELDRPWLRIFSIDQHALEDIQETMSKQY